MRVTHVRQFEQKETVVSIGTIILLGAFAGLTIYLGLPLAFFKKLSLSLRVFLSMFATGVLIFLLYDILAQASEPIGTALNQFRAHGSGGALLILDIFLLFLGLGLGLVGLAHFNTFLRKRIAPRATPQPAVAITETKQTAQATIANGQSGRVATKTITPEAIPAERTTAPQGELTPSTLALIIAIGIGLHNFSEGLAIGQSAVAGELSLVTLLIVGFGLHNMTEGFGIAGPLAGHPVSWRFIILTGLIAGGPTFLGTIVGTVFQSPQVFIFCLALAAGAIIYVVGELFGMVRRFKAHEVAMWGVLIGFILGYATDLIVTLAGH